MTLREATEIIPGLREIADSLEINSPAGRHLLLESAFMTDAAEISEKLRSVKWLRQIMARKENEKAMEEVCRLLMTLRDIPSTLASLAKGATLDDIGLFEVKSLILTWEDIRKIMDNFDCDIFGNLTSLEDCLKLLDPENNRVPQFFIYNAYDSRLAPLRAKMTHLDPSDPEAATLFAEALEIENEVRTRLCQKLKPYAGTLRLVLDSLALLDVMIAKAKLIEKAGLVLPEVKKRGGINWVGLFNPPVKERLAKDGKRYQPVDIRLRRGVCLVRGANMGGKTLLLKTLALAQAMAQFGFFVPAAKAVLTPVEQIMLFTGDSQSEQLGLSSFAAEMIAVNRAVKEVKTGKRMLVLIDEPARTTNPDEGKEISAAIISFFDRGRSFTVVTSHYSGLSASMRLRVKGLADADIPENCDIGMLQDLMDYSLSEDNDNTTEPPHEAIKVARALGIDPAILPKNISGVRKP